MKDTSGPAFSGVEYSFKANLPVVSGTAKGMSKREYFAGHALQGLLSNATVNMVIGPNPGNDNARMAAIAVSLADALLAELAK